jgi:hypothetical protein
MTAGLRDATNASAAGCVLAVAGGWRGQPRPDHEAPGNATCVRQLTFCAPSPKCVVQSENLKEIFANAAFREEYVRRVTRGLRSPAWLKKGIWSEPATFESHGPVGDQGYYPVRKLLSPVSSAQLKEWQASSYH